MSAGTDRYKWVALSNTTIGMLMATINASIVLIALPDIFRGIHLDPLEPGNSGYLLWMLMGFLVATAVLVVSFGRIGDMYGRVRMFNFGFAIFTAGSILLSLTWMDGSTAARWLIAMRIVQGVGGALLMANSSAILTDAFPHDERGLALGINAVSAIAGSFIGLVLGGVLAPVSWRLVFLVSVPVGILGTLWSWWRLEERGERHPAKIDWWGNLTFAVGLIAVLVGITYGIQPYGGHTMGWTNPAVLLELFGGLAVLGLFVVIELRTEEPMFRLGLFRIRAFTAGSIASLLASLGRGGLMFMLIIWLQGIWLPLHGYSFSETPLWAGIYMLPLTVGFLVAGPASGWLSDRFGARPFATGGMLLAALAFFLLELLPVDFQYWMFAALLLLIGLAMGLFASPNQTGIMNSLPPHRRGVGAGMSATFQNSAMVLSIGVFFTLMVVGLAASLPATLSHGLIAQGVPAADAHRVAHLPPVGLLFASFLGLNPIGQLLGPSLHHLPAANATYLTGRSFFPGLIAGPFASGLDEAFDFASVACLIAAGASWMRGGRYVHDLEPRHSIPAESLDGELALPAEGD
jgi:MFS family permease